MKLPIKITSVLLPLIALGMASCLKDKDFDDGLVQSVRSRDGQLKIVELKVTASSADNFLTLSLNPLNVDTSFNLIPVNLATPEVASEDINVTLTQNDKLVTDYNALNGTDYQVPTPAMFSLVNPGGVVMIPRGTHTGYLRIKLTPTKFLGGSWALGYQISSIDKTGYTISGNLNTGIYWRKKCV